MFLGLDLGTTNVKAIIVAADGRVESIATAPVERYCTNNDAIEQDIEQIWHSVQIAVRRAISQIRPARIRAVGVSSQGSALQLLDEDEKPLGKVISWLDSRGQPYDDLLTNELGSDFFARHIGYGASGGALGQILRLQCESPESLRPPRRIGFVGDIIVGRLCGRRVHDPTSLGISMLYNAQQKQPDAELLKRIGLRAEQLPCLSPANLAAGFLKETAAAALGLPAGIAVSPAVHDQFSASLGAASITEGDVNFSAGTAWVLLANTSKRLLPATPDAFVCPHPVNGLYGQMLSMKNGGSAIQWAVNLLGEQRAEVTLVDRLLAAASPGADGLRFWPFLSNLSPVGLSPKIKGRLSGITLAHKQPHFIRAVVEGLACELFRHIRQLVEAGICVRRLIMCGVSASAHQTQQIIADVTQLPVCCIETPDISAFGAAMLARSIIEPGSKLEEIVLRWAPPRHVVEPSENVPTYKDIYREYLEIFTESEPNNAFNLD